MFLINNYVNSSRYNLSVHVFFIASTCFDILTDYDQANVHLCVRQKKRDT